MHRPKSLSQLVIFSSRVRSIEFTVPPRLGQHSYSVNDGDYSARWNSVPSLDSQLDGRQPEISASQSTNERWTLQSVKSKTDSLGSLNPQLYQNVAADTDCTYFSENNIGRVWFSVEYSAETERLVVTLMHIKNLPSRDRGTTNACDPFIRVSLMPDQRRSLQSKVKKKTCNPVFDETIVFQVSPKDLAERAINLTVYDVNRLQRHVVIGHVVYPLTSNRLLGEKIVIWRDLEREQTQVSSIGLPHENMSEIQISLSYNDTNQRLSIGVFAGRNFTCKLNSSTDISEYYAKVKLTVSKSDKRKKRTAIVKYKHYRRIYQPHRQHPQQQQQQQPESLDEQGDNPSAKTVTANPAFNESFAFNLAPELLNACSVTVSAMQAMGSSSRDVLIGRVVLGSFMFARGAGLDHWTQMMAVTKQQISRWHKLSSR